MVAIKNKMITSYYKMQVEGIEKCKTTKEMQSDKERLSNLIWLVNAKDRKT